MDAANPAEIFGRPNTEAKIHEFTQYALWAESPGNPGKRARLLFGERNGAPRITVMTGAEQGPKALIAAMSPEIFEFFLSDFERVANTEGKAKGEIENLQRDPSFEGRAANFDDVPKIPKNSLHYGKNDEGVCWLAIDQKDAQRIIFKILPSAWHVFHKPDGSSFSKEEMSSIFTLSLIKSVRRSIARFTARINAPWERPAGQQSGYQNKTRPTDMSPPASTTADDSISFF